MSVVGGDPIHAAKAVVAAHEAAVRARNLPAILANAADDVVALVPNAPLVTGKPALRALYEQLLAMGDWDFGHDYAGAVIAGDLVMLHGVARGTLTPPGGAPSGFANNFMLTFRRQPDKQYRFWRVAFAPAAP